MKVLVTGDRNWTDGDLIVAHLENYVPFTLVHGAARGADSLAAVAAVKLHQKVISYAADWQLYGRAAGPIRNRQMLGELPDVVLAFHDNLALSKGTKDMVGIALKKKIYTVHVSHAKPQGETLTEIPSLER